MKVYFVRHGQTDWNVEHKIMGRTDIELNDEGRRQAQVMREKLSSVHFDYILSSPLLRAKETAEIIALSHPNANFAVLEELTERNFGDYEGKPNNGDYYGLWFANNTSMPNGESVKDLRGRVFSFLDSLAELYSGKDLLLVSHGGVGVIIESYFRGAPESNDFLEYVTKNGELKVYEIESL